jgi:hypothetical protein
MTRLRIPRFLAALVFTTRVMAQHAGPVEITAEPSHHLVMATGRVRVFDVHVAPHQTTLIHAHHSDYLFVTLGDADVTSARVGDTAVRLVLRDGETRYAKGQFAHSAANNSDREFHNTTIELLDPASHVVVCATACTVTLPCAAKTDCPTAARQLASDQWTVEAVTVPPGGQLAIGDPHGATLAVAVSDVRLTTDKGAMVGPPGTLSWLHSAVNAGSAPARVVLVEFKPSS